jgi:uncharacterized protein YecE (DUF72 family)
MPKANIGCSGFSYSHWRGNFYPEGLPQRLWFQHYSERFSTVELNVTFYRLPEEKTFRKWYEETPEDFTFALKGSKLITHIKRLRSPEELLNTFMQRASLLKEKLGVILWQFPPKFGKNITLLEEFINALKPYGVKNTFEFRDESWIDKDIISLLETQGQSLCMADWPPYIDDLPVTGDFVYIRRHGRRGRYNSCYTEEELKNDAKRIRKYLKQNKDVFIYFNNDAYGYAPKNALELKKILKS